MDLDSTIWSNAHDDIIYSIIKQSDRSSQIKWAGTSPKFHNFCVPKVWHTLVLYARDFEQYAGHVRGPDGFSSEDVDVRLVSSRGIIHFLLEDCGCTNLVSPVLYIRKLHIDGLGTDWRNAINPAFVAIAFPSIALSLPCLSNLVFDGPMTYGVTDGMSRISGLRELSLRGRDGHCEHIVGYNLALKCYERLDPRDLLGRPVDLRFETLENLRALHIGRLGIHEASPIAMAISHLHLTSLEICASVWSIGAGNHHDSFEGFTHHVLGAPAAISPIVRLLAKFVSESAIVEGNPWEGHGNSPELTLPISLRRLTLTDRYHWYTVGLRGFLQEALKPCTELAYLSLTLSSRHTLVSVMGDLPSPEYPILQLKLALPGGDWQMSDDTSSEAYEEKVLITNGLHNQSAFEGRLGHLPVSQCEAFIQSQELLALGCRSLKICRMNEH